MNSPSIVENQELCKGFAYILSVETYVVPGTISKVLTEAQHEKTVSTVKIAMSTQKCFLSTEYCPPFCFEYILPKKKSQ